MTAQTPSSPVSGAEIPGSSAEGSVAPDSGLASDTGLGSRLSAASSSFPSGFSAPPTPPPEPAPFARAEALLPPGEAAWIAAARLHAIDPIRNPPEQARQFGAKPPPSASAARALEAWSVELGDPQAAVFCANARRDIALQLRSPDAALRQKAAGRLKKAPFLACGWGWEWDALARAAGAVFSPLAQSRVHLAARALDERLFCHDEDASPEALRFMASEFALPPAALAGLRAAPGQAELESLDFPPFPDLRALPEPKAPIAGDQSLCELEDAPDLRPTFGSLSPGALEPSSRGGWIFRPEGHWLLEAMLWGDKAALEALLDAGINPNLRRSLRGEGQTLGPRPVESDEARLLGDLGVWRWSVQMLSFDDMVSQGDCSPGLFAEAVGLKTRRPPQDGRPEGVGLSVSDLTRLASDFGRWLLEAALSRGLDFAQASPDGPLWRDQAILQGADSDALGRAAARGERLGLAKAAGQSALRLPSKRI